MSDPDRLMREALALHHAGRLREAQALYARILAADPAHAEALHLSGLVAFREARFDDAIALLRQAIAREPENALYAGNLGNVLKDSGRLDEATASYRRALALDPGHVLARNNLGVVLLARGAFGEAIAQFRAALECKPDHFRAHFNLGNALAQSGDPLGAEQAYRRALTFAPDFGDALGELGLLLQTRGRYDDAVACFRRRVAVEPQSAVAHADLALALHRNGALDAAAAAYAAALRLDPQALGVRCNFCAVLEKACEWERLALELPPVLEAIEAGRAGVPIGLTTTLADVTPAMQLKAARANAATIATHAPLASPAARPRDRRLRIGYLSGDFREHATAFLTAELFELHDRARHEIHLFSYGPDDGSQTRARLRAGADRFIDLSTRDDHDAARAVADCALDILVDLNGNTDNGRMGIAALRPAPIQVNWLGFPGTLGAEWYDYLIADPHVVPPGAEDDYAEAIVRLPDCYQSNDRRRPRPAVLPSRAECGLPSAGVVLCCFNQSYKLTPDVFAAWMRVLAAVPESVLWLYDDNAWATASLRRRATQAGVAAERLVFAPHAAHVEHLARYALANLVVDTFPCTSHTTGSDALWMGCPLVTLTGATFAARVATSLLRNAGLPELAASSLPEHEALLLALARDPARLAGLRAQLAATQDTVPLFDTPRFTRNLERAYAQMAEGARSSGGPRGFDVG